MKVMIVPPLYIIVPVSDRCWPSTLAVTAFVPIVGSARCDNGERIVLNGPCSATVIMGDLGSNIALILVLISCACMDLSS